MPTFSKTKERIYQGLIILLAGVALLTLVVRLSREPQSAVLPTAYDMDQETYTWDVTEVATGLRVPWDMAFTPDGRLIFTERPGAVKVLETNGEIKTVATLPVASVGESGLTGMTLHPDFATNGYLYLYYTYRDKGTILNRVSRFTFKDSQLIDETIILNNLNGGSIHNGGRLRFGPDGKLWVLTGDAARPALAQNKQELSGKVLRMNDDGSVPTDNPTAGSLVYSIGHRNPQGLTWHPLTEELLVSEHGETAHDEINIVKAGGNYGWPDEKKCFSTDPAFTNPIFCSDEDTLAPSGIQFHGTTMWRFRYSVFVAGLRGQRLERLEIIDGKVQAKETLLASTYGRLRAVAVDKDGAVYVSTSNYDGRGQPKTGDDKILKLTPRKQ